MKFFKRVIAMALAIMCFALVPMNGLAATSSAKTEAWISSSSKSTTNLTKSITVSAQVKGNVDKCYLTVVAHYGSKSKTVVSKAAIDLGCEVVCSNGVFGTGKRTVKIDYKALFGATNYRYCTYDYKVTTQSGTVIRNSTGISAF